MKLSKKVATVWAVAAAIAVGLPAGSVAQQSSRGKSATAKNPSQVEFLKFAPGTFQMGCTPDRECEDNELPLREVRITKGFELAKDEVTKGQWIAVMGAKPCIEGDDPAEPMDCVTWNDTQRFIKKMNDKKDGYRYRLATEAEWEYTAKSDTTYAIHRDTSSEWVQDWYAPYKAGAQTDPRGPETGSLKVTRAGVPNVSSRDFATTGERYGMGFRLLREPVRR